MRKVGARRLGLPTLSISAWADAGVDIRPLACPHVASASASARARTPTGLRIPDKLIRMISRCFGCGERDKRQDGEEQGSGPGGCGPGIELVAWRGGRGRETEMELETESQTKTEEPRETASLASSSGYGREHAHVHPGWRSVPEG